MPTLGRMQASSSLSPRIPSESDVHAVFESQGNLQTPADCFCFFFSPDIWVFVFLGIFGS